MTKDILVNQRFQHSVEYLTSERMSAVDLIVWLDGNTTADWSWDVTYETDGKRKVAFSFKDGKDAMRFKLTMIGN